MKTKRTKKLLAFLITTAMAVLLMGTVVYADQATGNKYEPVAPGNVTFKKVLILPADTPVPTAGFAFEITSGAPMDIGEGKFDVKPGIFDSGKPSASTAIYTSGEPKDSSADDAATGDYNSSCTKTVTIDFGDVKFTEPGVYRYIIHEVAAEKDATTHEKYSNTAILNGKDIVMDVYVDNNASGELEILGTTMASSNNQSEVIPPADGSALANKTDKIVNSYPTNFVELKKTVTGNQGSKDEWFKFTVYITTPAGTDTSTKINVTGQTPSPAGNDATSYNPDVMEAQNKITDGLALSAFASGYDLYLQHGSDVFLQGIPDGCIVEIVETNANKYTVTSLVRVTGESDVAGTTSAKATINGKDVVMAFTNEKSGTIPTGVILSVAGLLVVGIFAVIGFVFFGLRSKRRYDED